MEFEDTGWGFRFAAIRELPENRRYVRITEYVAPASAFVSSMNLTRKIFILTVPVDNNHSVQWFFWYNPLGPITDEVRSYVLGNSDPDDSDMFKSAKALPMWGQDRQAMKTGKNFHRLQRHRHRRPGRSGKHGPGGGPHQGIAVQCGRADHSGRDATFSRTSKGWTGATARHSPTATTSSTGRSKARP